MSQQQSGHRGPAGHGAGGGRGPMGGFGGRGHGGHGMMPGQKAKNFKATMKQLLSYVGRHKWTIAGVWILAIISTVFTIVAPKILGQATDELFKGIMDQIAGIGGIHFEKIGKILLWLLGLYIISAVFSYLQGYVMAGVSMQITRKLRSDINEKIHKLPFRYFDKTNHGEVLSRITNDVDTINQTLNQSMTQIITSVTTVIGITVMMLTISWQMTLAALLILPLSMVSVIGIVKKSQTHFRNQQQYLGHVNGHVEEIFSSHEVVKAFNGEKEAATTFDEYNNTLYASAWKANFLSGMIMPITTFIGNLTYVVICILGGYLTVTGSLTVGGIQAFIQYVRSFTHPVTQIANISNVLQQTAAAAERVFEFLAEEEEVEEAAEALTVQQTGVDGKNAVAIEGGVQFEQVAFGYEPGQTVIRNFNANVNPGQKIAIVGPTGAGKSTIVKLLMRFYDVNSGTIRIDGHDIRDFERNELRGLFGMVLQDTWLFNGTIADNIRYGRLDATDEDVIEAAKAAQVDHFVRALPDGYEMVLNEAADNISQGQKQLLTIARAILSDPKILILDEATSKVDTRTEALIQKAMDHLMQGRTSFVIAHRLSTIRNADLILVMRDGDIIEQGSHDELLANDGFYAQLYQSQFDKVG
ncbi:multidrug ABC transporter ATP-binding protein [Ammoniphilus oxalaticus]|uniref:Multidrug ABC transporter ATP-binding protein n=1 Tax=Ammoniphilus oxalaticus TaxID=66863 RepID=A0A419SH74_9BACL|nr:ABC transporter ATP-binding protein [Ammoniphilus oxalaticus]RKD23142.1 multidrug ABC transporter ATP-binding protein [Ammoniphilus oxalaticus]